MGYLALVRHGQSVWNLENKFTGWVDVDLSEQGIEESKRAGELLKSANYEWQYAHTSRLRRAHHTLDFILDVLGQQPPIWEDSALNERHYGELQGLNKDETRKKYGEEQVHIWRRSYDTAPPGGESLADTSKRTLPYFKEYILKSVAEGKNVLVAAHGNSLRSIIMYLEGMAPEEILKFEIATGIPYLYKINADSGVIDKSILASR